MCNLVVFVKRICCFNLHHLGLKVLKSVLSLMVCFWCQVCFSCS